MNLHWKTDKGQSWFCEGYCQRLSLKRPKEQWTFCDNGNIEQLPCAVDIINKVTGVKKTNTHI